MIQSVNDGLQGLETKASEIEEEIFIELLNSTALKSPNTNDSTSYTIIDGNHPGTALEQDESLAVLDFQCEFESYEPHVCYVNELSIDNPTVTICTVNGEDPGKLTQIVTEMKFKDQRVNFLPQKLSQSFPNLQSIFVMNSQLTSLKKDDFTASKDLKLVMINENKLKNIDADTFEAAPHIEHLDLTSNEIQLLPLHLFSSLKRLRILLLSFNQIKIFNAEMLPAKRSLKIFKIDHNQLEKVDKAILRFLKDSNEIDFTKNVCVDLRYQKFPFRPETSRRAFTKLSQTISSSCWSENKAKFAESEIESFIDLHFRSSFSLNCLS